MSSAHIPSKELRRSAGPLDRGAAQRWAAVRECLVRSTVLLGSRRSPGVRRLRASMRYLCIILLSAVCAGCRSSAPKAPEVAESHFAPFSIVPPVADADPSIRHPVAVQVPTVMQVVRQGNSLTVSFPKLQTTNLMVGYKMVTGLMREDSIYRNGVAQPRGMSLQGGFGFDPGTNVLTLGRDGIPEAGQEFTIEHRVTMFETDLPAQHMWSPQSGKHYRVLWTQTFRETIR